MPGGRDDLVDLELVVVARADEAFDAGTLQLLVGHLHPALDGSEHLRVKELVAEILVPLELVPVLEERRAPAPLPLLDDRHERLARHVAAEDHDLGFVVLAGVKEFPPAGLRAVNVGREVDARLRFSGKESGYHFKVLPPPLRAARTIACGPRSWPASASPAVWVPPLCAPAIFRCARRCAPCSPRAGRSDRCDPRDLRGSR